MEHGLARIGGVLDAGQPRDRRRRATCLMGGEPAELERGDDRVAGRPRALAALDPRVVTREDEPLLVRGQAVERRAEQPRDGEDALGVDTLSAGLEEQTALVADGRRRRS